MNSVFHFAKLAIAVIAGVAAVALVYFNPPLATPTALISVAWSLMPE